ncbi:hypothetical protein GX586_09460 [bacterium]|nr:hypothetical protein [bacterium]
MIIIVLAYLVGMVPGAYLASRLMGRLPSPDRRTYAGQALSLLPLALVLATDAGKGALAVWLVPRIAEHLAGGQWAWLVYPFVSPGLRAIAALFVAVAAHDISTTVLGGGGKVATSFGGFAVLAWYPTLLAGFVFVIAAGMSRAPWFGSLLASWLLPALLWYWRPNDLLLHVAAVVAAGFATLLHRGEVGRAWRRFRR